MANNTPAFGVDLQASDQADELHTCRHALLLVHPVPPFMTNSGGGCHLRSAVQYPRDRIIVEFRGFPSNGRRFFGIIRQDAIQGIVDVRESPILRLWSGRRFKSFFGLTFSCQPLAIFESDSWAIHGCRQVFSLLLRSEGLMRQERCQCICMRILLAWYMVDVKVSEPLGHRDSCVVIGY